jgi:hypothetical protein
MGTIPSTLAAAQDTAGHSWANVLAATLKRWWLAYITWRIEQAAIAQLRSKSDLQLNDIRRHPDGSIDFDFYRTRAVTLRGQARRDALKAFGALVLTIMGVVAVSLRRGAGAATRVERPGGIGADQDSANPLIGEWSRRKISRCYEAAAGRRIHRLSDKVSWS